MIAHYVRRFVTSLSRRAPSPTDEVWAATLVSPAELALFARLSDQDRRHLIASARQVAAALDPEADRVWVQAALLHDVGKHDAALGTFGRVGATVGSAVLGRSRVRGWSDRTGLRGRLGRYELHGELGATSIRAAGGPEEAAWWSELHHHRDRFASSSIPPAILDILDAADR